MAASGFLDQFKDQLNEGNGEQQKSGEGQASGEQGEWTQEQIQQYYQQYGYYDYSQYGYAEGQQTVDTSGGGMMQDPSLAYADYSTAYQTFNNPFGNYVPGQFTAAALADFGRDRGAGPGQEPSRSVWLGNIHPDTTDSELHAAFAPFGMIEHVKILPAKNCAFVRFIELDAAIRAHSGMYGATIHGQQIKIGWGKTEPQQREELGPPPCRNLWLGNINPELSEEQIRIAFGTFGTIDKVRILPQKNCAFVNFTTLDAAIQAKSQMQGATLGDRPVKINFGKETQGLLGGIGDLSKPLDSEKLNVPPPPPEGAPPEDLADKAIIDKLADFVARNGLKFEHMMLEKQKDNPKFGFVEESHPHNAYYRFQIWCCRYPGVDPKSVKEPAKPYGAVPPPPVLRPAVHHERIPKPVPIEDYDISELAHLLETLIPTKDSIRASKTWIMARPFKIKEIATFVRSKALQTQDFEKRLNLIYLLHDVLHHSSRERGKEDTSDVFSDAFQSVLGDILRHAGKGEHPDNQEKIMKVVRIWEEKKIFPSTVIREYEQGMELQERREEPPTTHQRGHSDRHSHSRERDRERDRGDRDRDRDRDDRDRKRHRDRDRDRDGHRDRDRDRDRDDRHESKHSRRH